LHWVPGDPFSTHTLNVLHLLLPAGERWFIQVVNEAEPLVDDAELKAAIKPFIQQESWHAWAHQMSSSIWRSRASTPRLTPTSCKNGCPRWVTSTRDGHGYCSDGGSTAPRVAAALEPFNAVLGEWVIQNRGLDYAGADQTMLDLLRWHGAEELSTARWCSTSTEMYAATTP